MRSAIIQWSIIIIGLLIGLYFVLKPKEIKNKRTAIATLINFDYKTAKGGYSVYFYTYNNRNYLYKNSIKGNDNIGDKYIIEYDTLDPTNARILQYLPVFDSSDYTKKTIGRIFNSSKLLEYIDFEYYFDSTRYEANQTVLFDDKTKAQIDSKQSFEVEYLETNPGKAIIYLDRPVSLSR